MARNFMTVEESNARLNHPSNALRRRPISSSPALPTPATPTPAPAPLTHSPDPTLPDPAPGLKDLAEEESLLDIHDLLKFQAAIDKGQNLRGRKAGIRNRTVEENGSIGLTTKLLGSPAGTEMFGVLPPEQSILSRGYTSPQAAAKKNVKEELLDEIYSQGKLVTGKAFQKLLKSLDLVDDEKLEEVKDAYKLVQVAKSLSGIVKDMTPKDADVSDSGVHFHIYRPEQNQESDYETLEVGKDGTVTVNI